MMSMAWRVPRKAAGATKRNGRHLPARTRRRASSKKFSKSVMWTGVEAHAMVEGS